MNFLLLFQFTNFYPKNPLSSLRLVARNNGFQATAARDKQAMQFGSRSAKAANKKKHKSVKNADSQVSENLLKFLG